MSGGIIKADNFLIQASKILYAEHDDEGVGVFLENCEDELLINDWTLDRFYDEWRRALTY